MNSRSTFQRAASGGTGRKTAWPYSYDALLKIVESLGRKTGDLNTVEPELREAFKKFLIDSRFYLAAKNFDALLEEKSGNHFLRNDGTVSWFHEFIPIMMVLSAVRNGQRNYGVDFKDVDIYGGLEVAIITHLRHDSIEDHINKDQLRQQQYDMLEEIRAEGFDVYANNTLNKVDLIVDNIDLMSQRPLLDDHGNPVVMNGKIVKEDVVTYIARLSSSLSNPIVFMLKQADIAHNFATMFGAEKFPPERRAKRCNEKENMYGPRQDFYDRAKLAWKPFSKVISTFDGVVGDLLYKHFRYLENVDLFYQDSQYAFQRTPNDFPVSSRFLRDALRLNLPEIINPLHIGHKRMMASVDPTQDPEKFLRLSRFMDYLIKPQLLQKSDRFPYVFQTGGKEPRPTPIAFN